MAKVKKWIETRLRKPEAEYDEAKEEFEKAIGKPSIFLRIELPTGFEDLRDEFLNLEKDGQFRDEVKDLIRKRLMLEKRFRRARHNP